jgi:hypothetical protein
MDNDETPPTSPLINEPPGEVALADYNIMTFKKGFQQHISITCVAQHLRDSTRRTAQELIACSSNSSSVILTDGSGPQIYVITYYVLSTGREQSILTSFYCARAPNFSCLL